MAEYIEREAAIDEIEGATWYHISCQKNLVEGAACEADALYKATDIYNVIKSAPTADVVEVVRCKDCKYWQDNNDGYPHQECRWGNYETPDPDDYCSYGELKDEHPKKTYAQDFMEKFPDAPKCKSFNNGGCPSACRMRIYGGKCPEIKCAECWNEPMEE